MRAREARPLCYGPRALGGDSGRHSGLRSHAFLTRGNAAERLAFLLSSVVFLILEAAPPFLALGAATARQARVTHNLAEPCGSEQRRAFRLGLCGRLAEDDVLVVLLLDGVHALGGAPARIGEVHLVIDFKSRHFGRFEGQRRIAVRRSSGEGIKRNGTKLG